MCGIVGSVGEQVDTSVFKRAHGALSHRGPDDEGTYLSDDEQVYLGHQRLAIIDLTSAGHQPFVHDGRYQLVYNGEIYNYLEIRKELEEEYTFETSTDTEVLLKSYLKWGVDCVKHFNGMFAFALWDSKERKLFVARDRLGIKPFFYTFEDGVFRFASEIKALKEFGGLKQNEDIIAEYLAYGFYDHREETFFDGVLSLPAGHIGVWDNGRLGIQKYWDVRDAKEAYSYTDRESVEKTFKELLADSIKLRFRSDVPVGVHLSSGLDSNTLFAYAKEVTGGDVHTFTLCAVEEEYNECKTVSDILSPEDKKLWHQSVLSPEEFIPALEQMNTIQDQPYGGVPTIAYSKLNESSRDAGVTVVLEGQGVDELLAGYKYYRIEFLKDLLKTGNIWKLLSYAWKQKEGSFFSSIVKTIRQASLKSGSYSQDATPLVHQDLLSEEVKGRAAKSAPFDTPFRSYLLNAQYRDLKHTKLPRVLRFNDHVSMAYGRELRVPYLDHRIVEFCFWLPRKYKIDASSQKVLMRRSFGGILPEQIANRQKIAFGAMQTPWLRKYAKDFVYNILDSASFKGRPYWDHKRFRERVDAFFEGEGDNSFFLWQAINLELWLRSNVD